MSNLMNRAAITAGYNDALLGPNAEPDDWGPNELRRAYLARFQQGEQSLAEIDNLCAVYADHRLEVARTIARCS